MTRVTGRLLQHELADEGAPGGETVAAPRQVAPVRAEPVVHGGATAAAKMRLRVRSRTQRRRQRSLGSAHAARAPPHATASCGSSRRRSCTTTAAVARSSRSTVSTQRQDRVRRRSGRRVPRARSCRCSAHPSRISTVRAPSGTATAASRRSGTTATASTTRCCAGCCVDPFRLAGSTGFVTAAFDSDARCADAHPEVADRASRTATLIVDGRVPAPARAARALELFDPARGRRGMSPTAVSPNAMPATRTRTRWRTRGTATARNCTSRRRTHGSTRPLSSTTPTPRMPRRIFADSC